MGCRTSAVAAAGPTADELKIARLQAEQDKAALARFVRSMWSYDAVESLRRLLGSPLGVAAFEAFLKTEYSESNLEFYTAATAFNSKRDDGMTAEHLKAEADRLYNTFVKAGAEEQVNLPHTLQMQHWADMDAGKKAELMDSAATEIMKMMAMDTFPRFIQSSQCRELMSQLSALHRDDDGDGHGGDGGATLSPALARLLSQTKDGLPATRAEWLTWLAGVASILPACIVIADMTQEDQPLAFVNEFFCEMTGYSAEEAVGVNCRFLQGDLRSQEAARLCREGIAARQVVKVAITNFRKDGTRFQNLLAMKPVFEADGTLAFYLGVQYPSTAKSMDAFKLKQHERLLQLLPSQVLLADKDATSPEGDGRRQRAE